MVTNNVFEVKLTFETLTFSTHERVFFWKCQSFWDRKCLDLRGTRTSNLRIHAECSNLLSYQGQIFVVPCFEHWHCRYRYFLSKVNIWNVNCAHIFTRKVFKLTEEIMRYLPVSATDLFIANLISIFNWYLIMSWIRFCVKLKFDF